MSQLGGPTAYTLAGLRIISDLPLPGLAPCSDEMPTSGEIVIRCAPVCESLSSDAATFPSGQCNETELLLKIPGVGRYLLRNGNEILVDQAPVSDSGDVCAYLLGTMLGMLGHQRRIPPLHASAIDVAGGCVAFVGESGSGKSTLVAALAARQHQIIADDVCFLQLGNRGDVLAWPGVGRLRLWEDAMVALDYNGAGVEREFRRFNKYLIPIHSPRNPMKPRRLRRIYQLQSAPDCGAPDVERLYGAAAIEVLMQNIYRLGFAERMGYKPASFVVCAAAARDVPLFRFCRPRTFDALEETVKFLESHLWSN
jgi:hypothetical protein